MEERNMPKADFITSIILIAFGIGVFVLSIQMPRFQEQGVNRFSVPGIVPGVLGVIIGVLGIVLFIRSIIRKGYRLGISGQSAKAFFSAEITKRFALTILISAAYAMGLVGRIPYSIATILYVTAFIIVFEYKWKERFRTQWKRVLMAVIIGVLVGVVVSAVFRFLFLVDLPGRELVRGGWNPCGGNTLGGNFYA
jgi:hypothetical protein